MESLFISILMVVNLILAIVLPIGLMMLVLFGIVALAKYIRKKS